MGISYTKLTRYVQNPARAYAYYELNDKSAYDFEVTTPMLYGTLVHKMLAGQLKDWEPTDIERKLLFKYGDKNRGLKTALTSFTETVIKVMLVINKLYEHLDITFDEKNIQRELEFNGLFHGFVDFIDHENKIIIDYKIVDDRTDFNKAWNNRESRYDTWIHSTMYDYQAFIYQSAFEGYTHYIVAVTRNGIRSRVIDMGGVLYDNVLIDSINETMNDIADYKSGVKKPIVADDGSSWSEEHKPFELEVF